MENTEILKQLNLIQQSLVKKGIVIESLVADLKKLRELFIAEQMPRVVKVIRLTYEHLQNFKTFNIAIPEDEGSDSEVKLTVDEMRVESLSYLLSLFQKPDHKLNAEDLTYYLNAFVTYAENH